MVKAVGWCGTSAQIGAGVFKYVRFDFGILIWCETFTLEHLLKLMVWCLGMSEHWNSSEHLLKLILQCLDMLDVGMMQIIH
jgi:hypothetical protein